LFPFMVLSFLCRCFRAGPWPAPLPHPRTAHAVGWRPRRVLPQTPLDAAFAPALLTAHWPLPKKSTNCLHLCAVEEPAVDNFDKRQVVVAELLRDAGRSDRLIAENLGGAVSSGLVRKVRQKLEQEGKVQPAGKRIGKDDRRRGKPRPSVQALQVLLDAVAKGELTTDEASVLLGNVEVHPGITMPAILEAVATAYLLPEEAAVFLGGRR